MFFFFVGGVSPEVRKIIEKGAATCLRCGGPADLVEYDKVLKLFFVPVWRWPAKGPAVNCNDCGLLVPADVARIQLPPRVPGDDFRQFESVPLQCWSCSAPLSPGFKFCPQCGSPTK